MPNSFTQSTVGQLGVERPGRARIFERLGIDYCCGGKKPLDQACREKGLLPDQVERVSNPVAVMMQEHEDAGEALEKMRALTNGYAPPADACNSYRALLDGLSAFERDMHQHVHKENNILFQRAIEMEGRQARTEK